MTLFINEALSLAALPFSWGIAALAIASALLVFLSPSLYRSRRWGNQSPVPAVSRASGVPRQRTRGGQGQFYQNLLDKLHEIVFRVDHNGRCVYINSAWTDVMGFSIDETIDAHFLEFVHPEDREHLLLGFHALQMGEATILSRVARGLTKDGGCKWLEGRMTADFDSKGAITFVGVLSDVTQTHMAQERLRYLAHNDELTGLLNRYGFSQHVNSVLAEQTPAARSIAVLMVDLDRFRSINDIFGHATGDGVLQQCAARIKSIVQPAGVAARFGGDEFVLMLEDVGDENDASAIAEEVLTALAPPIHINGHALTVSATVGVSLQRRTHRSSEEIVRDADAAMHDAKDSGRGRVTIFEQSMMEQARRRLELETDLRGAVDRGEIEVHYQPIMDLRRGTVVSIEALCRWLHPVLGYVPPAEFIPIAEETGLVHLIGDFVLRQACKDAVYWEGRFGSERAPCIAINVSVLQLRTPEFAGHICRSLGETGLAPHRLILEITESVLMDNVEHKVKTLSELRHMGVKISLNDFGTGYSSMQYLVKLPVDSIKLDRSFVTNIESNHESQLIARSVIALAHSLGLTVVAEGIETAANLEELVRFDTDYAQGYHMCRPLAFHRATEYIDGLLRLEYIDIVSPVAG